MSSTRRRGGHRACLTTLFEKIDLELDKDTKLTELLLEYRSELLHQKSKLLTLDEEILNELVESEKDDAEKAVQKEISEASEIRVKIGHYVKKLDAFQVPNNTSVHSLNGSAAKPVKLPNIVLQSFHGNPMDWPEFWDLFRSAVHNRTDISGATKFHYLSSQLKGDAKNLISGFKQSDQEYDEAVDLLKSTYGKTKLIIKARLHALFDLEGPKPTSSALSKFRSSYEGHLRALRSLGCNITESGYVFAALLLRKLPDRIADNINRANNTDTWNLDEFRKAVEDEVNLLAASESASTTHTDKFPSSIIESSASFHVSAGKPKTKSMHSKPSINCKFCSNSHYSSQCDKYQSLESRKDRIKELHLCFNCLTSGHGVSTCKSNRNCRECTKRHHSAICSKLQFKVGNSSNSKNESSEKVQQKTDNDHKQSASMSITSHDELRSGNILPTAQVRLTEDGSNTATALFDGCSQKSFILKSLADDLNLNCTGEIDLALDGFRSCGSKETYKIAKLPIYTDTEVITINVIVIDALPERIFMNGRSNAVHSLQKRNITLADPNTDRDLYTHVALLIGIDNYYKFVYGQNIMDDLYLIPSKLGNLIAGNVTTSNTVSINAVSTVLKVSADNISSDIEKLWSLDKIGIDDSYVDTFKDTAYENLHFMNGKYIAGLPGKEIRI